jgi:ribonuclease HI
MLCSDLAKEWQTAREKGTGVIVLTDANSVIEGRDRLSGALNEMDNHPQAVAKILENFGLLDIFRTRHPLLSAWTFSTCQKGEQNASRIDQIWVDPESAVRTCGAAISSRRQPGTDHHLVLVDVEARQMGDDGRDERGERGAAHNGNMAAGRIRWQSLAKINESVLDVQPLEDENEAGNQCTADYRNALMDKGEECERHIDRVNDISGESEAEIEIHEREIERILEDAWTFLHTEITAAGAATLGRTTGRQARRDKKANNLRRIRRRLETLVQWYKQAPTTSYEGGMDTREWTRMPLPKLQRLLRGWVRKLRRAFNELTALGMELPVLPDPPEAFPQWKMQWRAWVDGPLEQTKSQARKVIAGQLKKRFLGKIKKVHAERKKRLRERDVKGFGSLVRDRRQTQMADSATYRDRERIEKPASNVEQRLKGVEQHFYEWTKSRKAPPTWVNVRRRPNGTSEFAIQDEEPQSAFDREQWGLLSPTNADVDRDLWNILKAEVTEEEMATIFRPAQGRAGGPSGIKQMAIHCLPELFRTLLIAIFDAILRTGVTPSSMGTGLIYPITKPDLSYRPISLLEITSKAFTAMLNNRITMCRAQKDPLSQLQTGFTRGKGAEDMARVTISCIEAAKANETELHILSTDIRRAYDSVETWSLELACRRLRLPEVFIRTMRNLQRSGTAQVIARPGLTDKFEVESGVRQGDPLSPTLFIFFLDPLLRAIETGPQPCNIDQDTPAAGMGYADDLIFFSPAREGIEDRADTVGKFLVTHGLELSVGKSQYWSNTAGAAPLPVQVFNRAENTQRLSHMPPIQEGSTIKVVGIELPLPGRHKSRLEAVTRKVQSAMAIGYRKSLDIEESKYYINCYVNPIIAYGLTCSLPHEDRLAVMDRQLRGEVRRAAGITHTTNVDGFFAHPRHGGLGVNTFTDRAIEEVGAEVIIALNSETLAGKAFRAAWDRAASTQEENKVTRAVSWLAERNLFVRDSNETALNALLNDATNPISSMSTVARVIRRSLWNGEEMLPEEALMRTVGITTADRLKQKWDDWRLNQPNQDGNIWEEIPVLPAEVVNQVTKVYTDGSAMKNPSRVGVGAVFVDARGEIVHEFSAPLPWRVDEEAASFVAESFAILATLTLMRNNTDTFSIISDNMAAVMLFKTCEAERSYRKVLRSKRALAAWVEIKKAVEVRRERGLLTHALHCRSHQDRRPAAQRDGHGPYNERADFLAKEGAENYAVEAARDLALVRQFGPRFSMYLKQGDNSGLGGHMDCDARRAIRQSRKNIHLENWVSKAVQGLVGKAAILNEAHKVSFSSKLWTSRFLIRWRLQNLSVITTMMHYGQRSSLWALRRHADDSINYDCHLCPGKRGDVSHVLTECVCTTEARSTVRHQVNKIMEDKMPPIYARAATDPLEGCWPLSTENTPPLLRALNWMTSAGNHDTARTRGTATSDLWHLGIIPNAIRDFMAWPGAAKRSAEDDTEILSEIQDAIVEYVRTAYTTYKESLTEWLTTLDLDNRRPTLQLQQEVARPAAARPAAVPRARRNLGPCAGSVCREEVTAGIRDIPQTAAIAHCRLCNRCYQRYRLKKQAETLATRCQQHPILKYMIEDGMVFTDTIIQELGARGYKIHPHALQLFLDLLEQQGKEIIRRKEAPEETMANWRHRRNQIQRARRMAQNQTAVGQQPRPRTEQAEVSSTQHTPDIPTAPTINEDTTNTHRRTPATRIDRQKTRDIRSFFTSSCSTLARRKESHASNPAVESNLENIRNSQIEYINYNNVVRIEDERATITGRENLADARRAQAAPPLSHPDASSTPPGPSAAAADPLDPG